MNNTIETTDIQQEPKLCINCRWRASSVTGIVDTYKCLAPQNKYKINVVDGSMLYYYKYCVQAREHNSCAGIYNCAPNCGIEARWYEEAPPIKKLLNVVATHAKKDTKLDLNNLADSLGL